MIKALACDIDGTLTDENRRLDMATVSLVREIEKEGVPVVLASGNILCLMEAASIFIGTTGPVIAENGGIVKDPRKGQPIYFCDVKNLELEKAFEHLDNLFSIRKVSRSDLRKTEIAIYPDVETNAVREALKKFNVRVLYTKFAIHITDPRVNKGVGLSAVADILGLKEEEFAAIGDSENDYEMLKRAGLGIGVGDEELADAARFVTKESFAEGGKMALRYVLKEIRESG